MSFFFFLTCACLFSCESLISDEDDMVEEDQIASAALDNNRLLVFRASADLSMLEPYFIAHRSGLKYESTFL